MNNRIKIFYDFEATSVSRDADPISVGLVATRPTYYYLDNEGHARFDVKEAETLGKELHYFGTASDDIFTFYAEFTDFNIDKCDAWVVENVVNKLQLTGDVPTSYKKSLNNDFTVKGDSVWVAHILREWLAQFDNPCFIADFDVIDKPMLIDLIATWDTTNIEHQYDDFGNWVYYQQTSKLGLPKHLPNIKYDQFFDIHTLFWLKGIDTDISREEFVGIKLTEDKHNALYDANVTWQCFNKLIKL
jgi:hypothetical protein